MTDKQQFKEMMKSLKNIENKLDVLVRLQRAVMPKPKLSPTQKTILKLCDKKHTIEDMMKETGKTATHVGKLLSVLRKKALIKSVKSKDKLVYERI